MLRGEDGIRPNPWRVRALRAEALLQKIREEACASEDARDFILSVIGNQELAAIIGAKVARVACTCGDPEGFLPHKRGCPLEGT